MRTRTRLTTPPGEEPLADGSTRIREPERYSPAIAMPQEPAVPGRHRRLVVTVLAVIVLALVVLGAFRLATAGQAEDPSLNEFPGATEGPSRP